MNMDERRIRGKKKSPGKNREIVGWMRGLEPPTPRITIWCSNQLSYNHRLFSAAKVYKNYNRTK
jgi:hypothetical protein